MRFLGCLSIGAENVNWGDGGFVYIFDEFCNRPFEYGALCCSQRLAIHSWKRSEALGALCLLELTAEVVSTTDWSAFSIAELTTLDDAQNNQKEAASCRNRLRLVATVLENLEREEQSGN